VHHLWNPFPPLRRRKFRELEITRESIHICLWYLLFVLFSSSIDTYISLPHECICKLISYPCVSLSVCICSYMMSPTFSCVRVIHPSTFDLVFFMIWTEETDQLESFLLPLPTLKCSLYVCVWVVDREKKKEETEVIEMLLSAFPYFIDAMGELFRGWRLGVAVGRTLKRERERDTTIKWTHKSPVWLDSFQIVIPFWYEHPHQCTFNFFEDLCVWLSRDYWSVISPTSHICTLWLCVQICLYGNNLLRESVWWDDLKHILTRII